MADKMTAAQWEPSAEQITAMCAEVEAHHGGACMRGTARFVLRRQHGREEAILAAVSNLITADPFFGNRDPRKMGEYDGLALAEARVKDCIAKLDAPKVPTLLEAAKAVASGVADAVRYSINGEHLAALKAAVEREERK